MTGKLLAGVSALVLALAMSHTAMAGTANGNTANGAGNDSVDISDDDEVLSGNVNNENRNDTNVNGNSVLNGNVSNSNNSLLASVDTSTNITVGNVDLAVSLQSLSQSNTGQTFSSDVVTDNGQLFMDATIEGNTAQNAAGVVQTSAQSGFQPQAQQASSIAAVGTVNIGGGNNTSGPVIVN